MTIADTSTLIPRDLPDGREILAEGAEIAKHVEVGLSLLSEQEGVRGELEYKQKMVAEGRVMTTMNIGLQTWADTAKALEKIWEETERRGFRIDRYQMQLDRRMGVPPEARRRAAKETGPMLESKDDWLATTRTVPIQPGLGDMMIGSPMSLENARSALEAGVTYIGNMSQFNWKYPSWDGTDVDQMIEMTRALGLMAAKQGDGATMQSYLDDGFPAQFSDYCSYIGWALFERYLVNDVIGLRLAISYGGLTTDPIMKSAVTMALEAITPEGTHNPFYHCNTTAYKEETDFNYGILGVDMLYLLLIQHRLKSGAAVLPIPVTEAIRIPSWQEIVEVHTLTRQIAEYVPQLVDFVDWTRLETIRDQLLEGGKVFRDNLLTGLEDLGVDLTDPLQMLLAVRRLGAVEIERRFGAGKPPVDPIGDYQPIIPTDTFKDFVAQRTRVRNTFQSVRQVSGTSARTDPAKKTMIVASTDVHEFGMRLVGEALASSGVDAVVAGTGVDPDEIADLALETGADAILVSTHNGMALTYATQLLEELRSRRIEVPVVFGGRLNQDVPDLDTPVEVRDELIGLGIKVADDVFGLADLLGLETATVG